MNKIDTLHPLIREEVQNAVVHVNTNILTGKVKMLVTQGLRTMDEQHHLYMQVPKVTNSDAGQSYHNYGLAFDFCMIDTVMNKLVWDTSKDFDGDKQPDWMEVVNYFKTLGYAWGGDFKSIHDAPHFEKIFGKNWRVLLALHSAGKVDKDGYVII